MRATRAWRSSPHETADTLATLRYAREQKQHVMSVVNVATSTIARESDVVMPTLGGPGIGVDEMQRGAGPITAVVSRLRCHCAGALHQFHQLSRGRRFRRPHPRRRGHPGRDRQGGDAAGDPLQRLGVHGRLIETPRQMAEALVRTCPDRATDPGQHRQRSVDTRLGECRLIVRAEHSTCPRAR